jgi:NitT/TauT family transport system ATP-binding protein
MDGRPKLEVLGVQKSYETARGTLTALGEVSLAVSPGEFVAIVGPSGCGKSTLLHIVAGLVSPTSGEVLVNGAAVKGPHPSRGVVFQGDAIFPWMTVEENVAYGLRYCRAGRPDTATRRALVEKYLRQVNLDSYGHLYPLELSGGMRKRAELARSYATEPEVLLMDEPFGSLDALTKQSLQLDLAEELSLDRSRTTVLVTHDIEEAVFLADRVVVMTSRPGRIAEEVEVPFPRPRKPDLVASPELQELRYRIRSRLEI